MVAPECLKRVLGDWLVLKFCLQNKLDFSFVCKFMCGSGGKGDFPWKGFQFECVRAQLLSCVWLFGTPWTVACQLPLFMEFPRQEYSSRLPFPPPGNLPSPGKESKSPLPPALARVFFYHWATLEVFDERLIQISASKSVCTCKSPSDLLKLRLWSIVTILRPTVLHFSQAPKWCSCCKSEGHSLRRKDLDNIFYLLSKT